METKTTPPLMPQMHIEGIMNHATQLIELFKTGKGFGVNLTPEQKAQFDKMMAENGSDKMLADLEEKMRGVKNSYDEKIHGNIPKV